MFLGKSLFCAYWRNGKLCVAGIVRVWYLLLEGLTGAVTTCPKEYQPQTLGLLFELLKAAAAVPGPEFAVFAGTRRPHYISSRLL